MKDRRLVEQGHSFGDIAGVVANHMYQEVKAPAQVPIERWRLVQWQASTQGTRITWIASEFFVVP